jgi:hypothetical protein
VTAVGSDRPRAYERPNRGAARRDREPTTPRASHDPTFIDGPPLDDGSLVDFDGFDTPRRSAWRTMETTETGSVATRPRPNVLPDATAVMDPFMGRDDRAGTRPRHAGHVPFAVPRGLGVKQQGLTQTVEGQGSL